MQIALMLCLTSLNASCGPKHSQSNRRGLWTVGDHAADAAGSGFDAKPALPATPPPAPSAKTPSPPPSAAVTECTPKASTGESVTSDLNPPTWSWVPCPTAPNVYRVSLDGGAPLEVNGTTYTPPDEIEVGVHTLTVVQLGPAGILSQPADFVIKVTPRAVVGAAADNPGVNALIVHGLAITAVYHYPIDGQSQPIDAGKLKLAGENGFVPEDILQGRLSDCYLMAVLMGVANARPALLDATVYPATDAKGEPLVDGHGYGLYMVKFYLSDAQGKTTAWSYMTDAQIPFDSATGYAVGARLALGSDGDYHIGIPLIEKAFARLNQDDAFLKDLDPSVGFYTAGNGYADLNTGGFTIDTLRLYAGKADILTDAASTPFLAGYRPGQGQVITLSLIYQKNPLVTLPSGATTAMDTHALTYTSAGGKTVINLPLAHVYTVLGVQDGVATVRNPWGLVPNQTIYGTSYEYGYGTFTMPVGDLSGMFIVNAAMTSDLAKSAVVANVGS